MYPLNVHVNSRSINTMIRHNPDVKGELAPIELII